jgi:eukaryotic translation initiation factor 2C
MPPEGYYHKDDTKHLFAKPSKVNVQQYRVLGISNVDVYQHRLAISPLSIKPIIIEKI